MDNNQELRHALLLSHQFSLSYGLPKIE